MRFRYLCCVLPTDFDVGVMPGGGLSGKLKQPQEAL